MSSNKYDGKRADVPDWFKLPLVESRMKVEEDLPPLKLGKSVWGGDKIEIIEVPDVENKFPLSNGPVQMTITGAPHSGKSYLLLSLIPCVGKLTHVIFCSKVDNKVNKAVGSYCREKGIEYAFVQDPWDAAETIEKTIETKSEDTWCLCIFDDFSNHVQNRGDAYNQITNKTSGMLRNYGFHSISITQQYSYHPTLLRNNVTCMVVFRMVGNLPKHMASKDWGNLTGHSDKVFLDLYHKVIKEQHGYIMSNLDKTFVYLPKKFGETLHELEINNENTYSDTDSE